MTAPLLVLPALACVLGSAACFVLGGSRWTPRVSLTTVALAWVSALALAARVLAAGPQAALGTWLRADALSALLAVLISTVATAVVWYGRHYIRHVMEKEHTAANWAAGRYDALELLLIAAMLLAAVANNLGLLWIAVEFAMLLSALLVGYFRRPGAVEAGWKYLILGSVAVALALFATVLLYASARAVFGEGARGLAWSELRGAAHQLDPRFVRLAFLFALAGYGAKAGLAPMHAWLPEAYGQAPAPASALLSTALLATALGALLRVHALTAACVGPAWSEGLLALFGAVSLAVAVPFIVVQGEYKRMLAWSSLEHTGLVTLAIGLGTPLAAFAGLLHLLVQSFAKALAFLVGGTLIRSTGSHRMDHWSGVLVASPRLGVLLAGAGIGLMGLPPAGTFVTEWLAITGGLRGPRPGFAVAGLVALIAAFAGLAFHWTHMLLGKPRRPIVDPLPGDSLRPLALLLALVMLFGAWIPGPVRQLAERAAEVLKP